MTLPVPSFRLIDSLASLVCDDLTVLGTTNVTPSQSANPNCTDMNSDTTVNTAVLNGGSLNPVSMTIGGTLGGLSCTCPTLGCDTCTTTGDISCTTLGKTLTANQAINVDASQFLSTVGNTGTGLNVLTEGSLLGTINATNVTVTNTFTQPPTFTIFTPVYQGSTVTYNVDTNGWYAVSGKICVLSASVGTTGTENSSTAVLYVTLPLPAFDTRSLYFGNVEFDLRTLPTSTDFVTPFIDTVNRIGFSATRSALATQTVKFTTVNSSHYTYFGLVYRIA